MDKIVIASNDLQENYKYVLNEPIGKNFGPDFFPELTPKQMLELGVFGGWYRTVTIDTGEFPKDWYKNSKVFAKKDISLNYFKIDASQPLEVWQKKGWINNEHDPNGWFQWYCRYYMGRRLDKEDERQIKRWKAMNRHIAQVKKNCKEGDMLCRPKQRQALLHWAYDSRDI